jgi:hypothetical protein
MATTAISITINTPAGITIPQVVDALSAYWGYSATLTDGSPNPQTKGQFIQQKLAQYVKQSYIAARAQTDAEAARIAAINTANGVGVS